MTDINFKEQLYLKIFDDEVKNGCSLDKDKRMEIAEEVIAINTVLETEETGLLDIREGLGTFDHEHI